MKLELHLGIYDLLNYFKREFLGLKHMNEWKCSNPCMTEKKRISYIISQKSLFYISVIMIFENFHRKVKETWLR